MLVPPDGSNEWFCNVCFSWLCCEGGRVHYYSLGIRL